MTHMAARWMVLLSLMVGASQASAAPPPSPYYDWGACPFECCSYREWTTNGPVTLYPRVRATKTVVARLSEGEPVLGLTGVVITTTPGRVKVLRPVTLDEQKPVAALPGDVLYTLHPLGEGFDLFWFKGQLHSHVLAADKVEPKPLPDMDWQVLALPKTEWWVKVRTAKRKIGWSKETQRFDHMDACE